MVASAKPIPDVLINKPEVWEHNLIFWLGFLDLRTSRPLGFGSEGAITWRSIVDYCADLDLDEEQTEDMLFFVRHLDQHHLQWMANEANKERKKEERKAKSATRGRR